MCHLYRDIGESGKVKGGFGREIVKNWVLANSSVLIGGLVEGVHVS